MTGDVSAQLDIAKYDLKYDTYASINFLEVKMIDSENKKYAFISFQSINSPFDSVKVAELDTENRVAAYATFTVAEVVFYYVKSSNGQRDIIDNFEVKL